MKVKIGQASFGENGIRWQAAGNQTGRELNFSKWYDGGWTIVLRPLDPVVAEAMAKACEAGVNNRNIGYDQSQRNTLRAEARAYGWKLDAIGKPCETDCSAFMAVCAEAAGVRMEQAYTDGNAPATFQMREKWQNTGAFELLTDKGYLKSDKKLRRGDVLVNESQHTCMVLSDGAEAYAKNGKIIVDGVTYPVDVILVRGTNYIRVRDLAAILGLEVTNQGSIAVLNTGGRG